MGTSETGLCFPLAESVNRKRKRERELDRERERNMSLATTARCVDGLGMVSRFKFRVETVTVSEP